MGASKAADVNRVWQLCLPTQLDARSCCKLPGAGAERTGVKQARAHSKSAHGAQDCGGPAGRW